MKIVGGYLRNKMDFYLIYCSTCKKKTKQIKAGLNLLRGVKFLCLACGKKGKYHNLDKFNPEKYLEEKQNGI